MVANVAQLKQCDKTAWIYDNSLLPEAEVGINSRLLVRLERQMEFLVTRNSLPRGTSVSRHGNDHVVPLNIPPEIASWVAPEAPEQASAVL
jgi:hypothetical protein